MSRPFWLVGAFVLSLVVLSAGWTCASSAFFLVELLSDGRWRPLSSNAPKVSVRALPASAAGRAIPTDLYTSASFAPAPGLVLVHGLSPAGKDEPRLRRAAALLARAGWAVAVPTVEGLTILRLRPDDSRAVVAAVRALEQTGRGPVAIVGISVGASPAFLAAADPAISPSVSAVMALGGYASAVELLRYTLTGAYRLDGVVGRHPVDAAAVALFSRANSEFLDAAGRRLVENRDPEALDGLVAALSPEARRLLAALSPAEVVARIRAPLFLIHGRDDMAVPYTESVRLERAARAAGREVRTVVVGAVAHVEPGKDAGPLDLGRLWASFYAFRARAARLTSPDGHS